mmetsp:Transcript_116778/g.232770  ORF Transcript_116778/g.232770 Transcript_116778/m.232770 type:complete len:111 (-) Transcript_116778:55-387(-)
MPQRTRQRPPKWQQEEEQEEEEQLQEQQRASCLDPMPLPLDLDQLQLLGGRTTDHRRQIVQDTNLSLQTMESFEMANDLSTFLKASWTNASIDPQESGIEAALQCRFVKM